MSVSLRAYKNLRGSDVRSELDHIFCPIPSAVFHVFTNGLLAQAVELLRGRTNYFSVASIGRISLGLGGNVRIVDVFLSCLCLPNCLLAKWHWRWHELSAMANQA